MEKTVSRRAFIGGAGVLTAAAAMAGLSGCANNESSTPQDPAAAYLPETWDRETDILVVGFGGAGIAACITALDEGLGEVLAVEAAPEAHEGGNTRVSAEVVFSATDKNKLVEYQKNLNAPYSIPDDRLDAWADGIMENVDWLNKFYVNAEPVSAYSPEYPGESGSDSVQCHLADSTMGKGILWDRLREAFDSLNGEVLHNTRAVELVQHPLTKEVLGAKMEDGSYIKARKGVLLACGGFENDPALIQTYWSVGSPEIRPCGTPYNRGDGIRMAQSVGANLWHMNNYAGIGGFAVNYPFTVDETGEEFSLGACFFPLSGVDYIYVGKTGKRFMCEERTGLEKHGKINNNGSYEQAVEAGPTYAVFGQQTFDGNIIYADPAYEFGPFNGTVHDSQSLLDAGSVVKADTIEELAEKLGIDPSGLAAEIKKYNDYCKAGEDREFHRGEPIYTDFVMSFSADDENNLDESTPAVAAFDLVPIEPPYYGAAVYRALLNTQGGPEQSANQEVLHVNGSPIPRLYAAGECGAPYPYMYNGGGNVSEAISSGRIAARNIGALEPWTTEA